MIVYKLGTFLGDLHHVNSRKGIEPTDVESRMNQLKNNHRIEYQDMKIVLFFKSANSRKGLFKLPGVSISSVNT